MADPFNRNPVAVYDQAEEISGTGGIRVRRLTCDNASPMTFTGTQSYLVGSGQLAVIDPGPLREAHLDRLLAALEPGEEIAKIFVTHTHIDHSPGACWLAGQTGAPVLAFGTHGAGMSAVMRGLPDLGGGEGGDRSFVPAQTLGHGEVVDGADWSLTALHTPGHLSNHLAFALGDTGVVFTGDTVMGWATTLVSPPEGDMAAFMSSLELLSDRNDHLYLPGHGHPVTDPLGMVAHQIGHRQNRAVQILEALEAGEADASELAARIYTDVDPALLPAAARNVLSTLIWKVSEGSVAAEGEINAASRFSRI